MTDSINSLLQQNRAVIMGIVNVTPDSFSDGGRYLHRDAALKQVEVMVSEGVDIIDIGGESTRPGAAAVNEQIELDRVIPIIEKVNTAFDVPVSIDTYKPAVMEAAITAGASMINDVNALQAEGAINVVAKLDVPVCLMHKQGEVTSMQQNPQYQQVVNEVIQFLRERTDECVRQGIAKHHIIVDPGIGFGKTLQHNLALLNAVPQLINQLASPVLIGVSRKSMIDALLQRNVNQRIAGSIGLAVQAVLNGAKIVRVHDVIETHDAIKCVEAVRQLS